MSLTSSLFAGVSGLNAQGTSLGIIGDNIANISTVGFKAGSTTFASLVTGNVLSEGGAGSVARNRLEIDQQGLIQNTGISTDFAVSGQGMIVVKDLPELQQGEFFYTRAGSFRQDDRGFFVNSAGFFLQAWPLDNAGRRPGEVGNLNTTSNQLLESLESVNTRDISGIAFATTEISLGLNLDAGEPILAGAGSLANPTGNNANVSADDILEVETGLIEDGDTLSLQPGSNTAVTFTYGGFARSNAVTAGIFGATSAQAPFTTLTDGDNFTINTVSSGLVTYTYVATGTPNTSAGQFNNLQTLSTAISNTPGMTSRIGSDNRLYISPIDAGEAMTLANGSQGTIISGGGLGAGFVSTTTSTANRFNTLSGLAAKAVTADAVSAVVNSPAINSDVTLTIDDPLLTATFTSTTGGTGNLLTAFGLPVAAQQAVYNASDSARNMASGNISPAFSRNVRIFDSLGTGHDVRINFVKSAENQWLVELFVTDEAEIATSLPDGQLASGVVTFNGDGTLQNVGSGLLQPIAITWNNQALESTLTLDLGTAGSPSGTPNATTIGQANGLSQFDGPFNVQFADQNGAGSGLLSSLEIDDEGFIIANFSNGQSRSVFKIPLATFPNVNGLNPKAGNVFQSSDASGEFSLAEAGGSGVGQLATAALESANVELADELTILIVAQRAFQANTKVISSADELLEELNRI